MKAQITIKTLAVQVFPMFSRRHEMVQAGSAQKLVCEVLSGHVLTKLLKGSKHFSFRILKKNLHVF